MQLLATANRPSPTRQSALPKTRVGRKDGVRIQMRLPPMVTLAFAPQPTLTSFKLVILSPCPLILPKQRLNPQSYRLTDGVRPPLEPIKLTAAYRRPPQQVTRLKAPYEVLRGRTSRKRSRLLQLQQHILRLALTMISWLRIGLIVQLISLIGRSAFGRRVATRLRNRLESPKRQSR